LLESAGKAWASALQESRFEDTAAFEQASMDVDTLAAERDAFRRWDEASRNAAAVREQAAKAIENRTRPDVDRLERTEHRLRQESDEAAQAFHRAQERLAALVSARTRVADFTRKISNLETRYGTIGRLAEVSAGGNALNINLQRFVLSVLLDDVLIQASSRLGVMSRGRYTLYRQESPEDKRRQSGLELTVEDAYTGKRRAAATLSGGESFMAALSLALGLSDVVQAYAGGIRLDALFVDEGFGSLDNESLQLAIDVLLELRAGGRMIGVISHVSELKEWIDLRIDVTPGADGSRIRIHAPGRV
jgi:exonuclease SbcC